MLETADKTLKPPVYEPVFETVRTGYLFNRPLSDDECALIRAENSYQPAFPGESYAKVVVWRTKRRTLVTVYEGLDV